MPKHLHPILTRQRPMGLVAAVDANVKCRCKRVRNRSCAYILATRRTRRWHDLFDNLKNGTFLSDAKLRSVTLAGGQGHAERTRTALAPYAVDDCAFSRMAERRGTGAVDPRWEASTMSQLEIDQTHGTNNTRKIGC